jgi:hypothetical protein
VAVVPFSENRNLGRVFLRKGVLLNLALKGGSWVPPLDTDGVALLKMNDAPGYDNFRLTNNLVFGLALLMIYVLVLMALVSDDLPLAAVALGLLFLFD